jgi:DNA-directed RNA polymerase specialized sigma24 family protein
MPGTRANQPPPFERVVQQHGPSVLRFCVAQAGAARGEDCFQETMLAALRSYDTVRDPEAIRAWLFSIAHRKAVDAHRATAREAEPVAHLGAQAGIEPGGADDGEPWMHVRALPEKQRQAVTLRFMADLSHAQVAAAMQITEAAARRNVFEGLKRLRGEVERP